MSRLEDLQKEEAALQRQNNKPGIVLGYIFLSLIIFSGVMVCSMMFLLGYLLGISGLI